MLFKFIDINIIRTYILIKFKEWANWISKDKYFDYN